MIRVENVARNRTLVELESPGSTNQSRLLDRSRRSCGGGTESEQERHVVTTAGPIREGGHDIAELFLADQALRFRSEDAAGQFFDDPGHCVVTSACPLA